MKLVGPTVVAGTQHHSNLVICDWIWMNGLVRQIGPCVDPKHKTERTQNVTWRIKCFTIGYLQIYASGWSTGSPRSQPRQLSAEGAYNTGAAAPDLPLRQEMHLRKQVQVLPSRTGVSAAQIGNGTTCWKNATQLTESEGTSSEK